MINFTVPGKPQGKARARTGYNPVIGRVTSHTPEATANYENWIKTCYINARQERFSDGIPIKASIVAFFEPPKSTSKKQRQEMLAGRLMPTKKPDIDNIAKVVLDALNGLAYKDDTQVVTLELQKLYAEEEKLEVCMEALEKQQETN